MRGPEFYFEQRWKGLEQIARIVGKTNYSSKRNSNELSVGEELQDLYVVIETIRMGSVEIQEALQEGRLSGEAIVNDLEALDSRIKRATEILKKEAEEIDSLKRNLLMTLWYVRLGKLADTLKINAENDRTT